MFITDDPTDINAVCLSLDAIDALTRCPEWGVCRCAVCEAYRTEHASEIPATTANVAVAR